mmetsp:Transcript_44895/g.109552  ORF Transcript_44895/g.109552 Transcript_44895/m.109552 type:complete len:238 (+) Transcript_44895:290-1003(+)
MAAREGVHVSSLNLPLWFWSRHVMTPSRCPRPTTPTTVLQPFTAIELFIVSDRKTSLSRMRGSTTLGRSSASCASYTSTLLAISPTCSCSSVRLLFANMVLPTNWAALHFSSLSMPLQHLSSVISTGLSPNTICAPQSSPAALAALKSTPTCEPHPRHDAQSTCRMQGGRSSSPQQAGTASGIPSPLPLRAKNTACAAPGQSQPKAGGSAQAGLSGGKRCHPRGTASGSRLGGRRGR